MRYRSVFMLLWAIGVVLFAGCFATHTQDSGDASTLAPKPAASVTVTSEPPEGILYLMLLEAPPFNYDLYKVSFTGRRVERLTTVERISAVGGCDQKLVVAGAQKEVGYSDHIQEIRGSSLHPIDGLGLTEGFTPALGPDCRLVYGWPDRAAEPSSVGELRLWDPKQRKPSVLFRADPDDGLVTGTAWGPNGEIAALTNPPRTDEGGGTEVSGRAAAIIIVDPDGSVRQLDAPTAQPGVLTWGATWMGISDEDQGATVFFDPDTKDSVILPDWRPVAWSPDGSRLLVTDSATEQRMGLVDQADPTSVEVFASFNRAVAEGVWLAS